ncbi:MAG: hypothetical protein R3301_19130, partial [Saprospiraceae bacterium]|nr:hypothetical protein [Saprospiraceae bacterium]
MSLKLIFLSTTLMISATHAAQIGIGTSQPDRPLEVRGSGAQALRIHTSSNFAGTAGIELVRGTELNSALDWHISNDQGVLKITSGDFNLYTGFDLQLRIDTDDEVGIGTNVTHARLHIDGGGEASLGSDGFLQLGLSADENLIMDQNEIQARNNGNPASLFVQNTGGSTHFNAYGGYVRMGFNDGRLGVGTSNPSHRTSIHNDGWHLYLNNDGNLGADNEWYIGASDHTWAAGDDQLVFSPTSSSADAVLRLRNVTENDGTIAPVSIHSQNGQTLLLDGNEIDCASGALYINHNSGQNTYINPSGGKVGIG